MLQCSAITRPRLTAAARCFTRSIADDDGEDPKLEQVLFGRLVAAGIELREREAFGNRLNHLR